MQYQVMQSHTVTQFSCQACGAPIAVAALDPGHPGAARAHSGIAASPSPLWANGKIWLISGVLLLVLAVVILLAVVLRKPGNFNAKKVEPVSLNGVWYGKHGCAINVESAFQLLESRDENGEFEIKWALDPDSEDGILEFEVTRSPQFKKNSSPKIFTTAGTFIDSPPGKIFIIEGAEVQRVLVGDIVFHVIHHPIGRSKVEFDAVARLNGAEVVISGTTSKGKESIEFKKLLNVVATFQMRDDGVKFPKRPGIKKPG